jgi:hypothetical protein
MNFRELVNILCKELTIHDDLENHEMVIEFENKIYTFDIGIDVDGLPLICNLKLV